MPVHRKDVEKQMESNVILQYLKDFNKFLEGFPTVIMMFYYT